MPGAVRGLDGAACGGELLEPVVDPAPGHATRRAAVRAGLAVLHDQGDVSRRP